MFTFYSGSLDNFNLLLGTVAMVVNFIISPMRSLTSNKVITQQFEGAVSYSRCNKNNGTNIKFWT